MKWASDLDFEISRKNFPFPCVDLVVMVGKDIILLRRRELPYRGYWHLPGGIIHKGQSISQKIEEIADREIRGTISITGLIGVYENINTYRHDISYCFMAKLAHQSHTINSELKTFRRIPSNTIPYHKLVIRHARQIALVMNTV